VKTKVYYFNRLLLDLILILFFLWPLIFVCVKKLLFFSVWKINFHLSLILVLCLHWNAVGSESCESVANHKSSYQRYQLYRILGKSSVVYWFKVNILKQINENVKKSCFISIIIINLYQYVYLELDLFCYTHKSFLITSIHSLMLFT